MEVVYARRAPTWPQTAAASPYSVLIGVMSGDATRRHRMRAALAGLPQRVVFVVGRGAADDGARPNDVMRVNVTEGVGVIRRRVGTPSGTLTTLLKLKAFLEFAARQPEPWVARADDDVALGVEALRRYATPLARAHASIVMGVYEYYNVVLPRLRATGHGHGWRESSHAGQTFYGCRPHLNYSGCTGPFAFPKGPLLLMSNHLVRRVVASTPFARLPSPAMRVQNRIHDDMLLGLWIALLPNVTYVRWMRKSVWMDRTGRNLTRSTLLAHKTTDAVPPAPATARWRESLRCEPAPPCARCTHDASQQTCFRVLCVEDECRALGLRPGPPARVGA